MVYNDVLKKFENKFKRFKHNNPNVVNIGLTIHFYDIDRMKKLEILKEERIKINDIKENWRSKIEKIPSHNENTSHQIRKIQEIRLDNKIKTELKVENLVKVRTDNFLSKVHVENNIGKQQPIEITEISDALTGINFEVSENNDWFAIMYKEVRSLSQEQDKRNYEYQMRLENDLSRIRNELKEKINENKNLTLDLERLCIVNDELMNRVKVNVSTQTELVFTSIQTQTDMMTTARVIKLDKRREYITLINRLCQCELNNKMSLSECHAYLSVIKEILEKILIIADSQSLKVLLINLIASLKTNIT
jgi:hypothetical protein